MTGYGKTLLELEGKVLTIEFRTLNSKQSDIILKIPSFIREKESEIRSLILEKLVRGKLELYITVETTDASVAVTLNKELAKKYYQDIKSLAAEIGEEDYQSYISLLVKMPDVMSPQKEELDDTQWESIKAALTDGMDQVDEFRIQEGKALEKDITTRINLILDFLQQVEKYLDQRTDKVKERLLKELNQLSDKIQYDRNRFEQEMIYYLDKLDINEEKVRLKKHCEYFLETLASDSSNGKKLGFIAQEIDREINTLGAKANEENIQKLVVQMKDELEKIKEQLFNIL